MNCSQARALLATQRELEYDSEDFLALETHLAECAACHAVQAQYQHIGVKVRALPPIEVPPEARTRLMEALATEHVRFLQRTPISTRAPLTPTFLAPYVREAARNAPHTDHLAAFATADTGPLPVLQMIKPRRSYRQNHFTVIGIAASVLLLLMVGSVTSLLFLSSSSGKLPPPPNPAQIVQTSEVQLENHQVKTVYPYVASAIEIGENIYYTTHNADRTSWQLEHYSEKTKLSTVLLEKPSTQEIVVLGGTRDWLTWLQLDAPETPKQESATQQTPTPQQTTKADERAWSLHVLSLKDEKKATPTATTTPVNDAEKDAQSSVDKIVHQDTFISESLPGWVHRPIQGIWFYQHTLLVTLLDSKGTSYLKSYTLNEPGMPATELDTASDGRILTSPTANADGSSIYWAETWYNEKNLQSNIWTRQIVDAPLKQTGQWAAHKEAQTYLFRDDGKSFRPQIVSDTLFLLSTATGEQKQADPNNATSTTETESTTPTTTATPSVTASTPTATATIPEVKVAELPGGTLKVDPGVFKPQLDEVQIGRVLTFTNQGVATTLRSFTNIQNASALQGGTHFLLWIENGQKVRLYDVERQIIVNVGAAVPQNATFLSVNGDTAVVITKPEQQPSGDNQLVPFNTFKWPWTLKTTTE